MTDDILSFRCKHRHTAESHPRCWEEHLKEDNTNTYLYTEDGNMAEVSATLDEDTVNSPEKLLKAMKVDTSVWEVYKKQIGKSPAWRKDRSVQWEVVDGQVINGKVADSGKIKVLPVYTVKLWLRRKTEEIRTGMAMQDFKLDIAQLSLKRVKAPTFPKPKEGFMLEVEMPDAHIGKQTWGEESGLDAGIDTQVRDVNKVMIELLSYASKFEIEKIVFPIGHDF